jgi:hypothetical protein
MIYFFNWNKTIPLGMQIDWDSFQAKMRKELVDRSYRIMYSVKLNFRA